MDASVQFPTPLSAHVPLPFDKNSKSCAGFGSGAGLAVVVTLLSVVISTVSMTVFFAEEINTRATVRENAIANRMASASEAMFCLKYTRCSSFLFPYPNYVIFFGQGQEKAFVKR